MTVRHFGLGFLCAGLMLMVPGSAEAGWGSWGSSWGGGGSWGSDGGSHGSAASHGSDGGAASHGSAGSGGSWGGSTGGSWGGSSGGSWGSGLFHGGLISRLRAHHQKRRAMRAAMASHGSSGGSWGGSTGGSWGGSSGASSGGGSSGGSWGATHGGSWGGSTGGGWGGSTGGSVMYGEAEDVIIEAPAEGSTMDEGEMSTEPPAPTDSTRNDESSGTLIVSVPAEATLLVNGRKTTSMGTRRRFVSKGLQAGFRYPYTVKAVIDRDGEAVEMTKEVDLRPGELAELSFDFDQAVETTLTVKLPAEAELVLAGSETSSKGEQRRFTTTKLVPGQLWSNYSVVVTLNQDGRQLTKTQTIDLRGGESRTLTFDFEQEQVAAR